MTIYPAIDLRGGRCVRLMQGAFDRETVYGDDPIAVARRWEEEGAAWLHVVDLDGARAGRPVQQDIVRAICAAVRIPVQTGGGLRDRAAVEGALAAGAVRVVLGTAALRDEPLARELCAAHPGRIAFGLDARGGRLRTVGWTEESGVGAVEAAARLGAFGAAALIYTDIERDGTERGPDLAGTAAVARAAGVPVIASGGVGSLADVRALAALAGPGVEGVIVGRALYTGAVTLAAALAAARGG
jgi:phosphoribosylformimino-5-aminoimidazole carboxamide ribotide isomerase